MDRIDRRRVTQFIQNLRLRARQLPTRGRTLLRAPLGKGFVLVGVSVLFAAWAHHSSTRHAWELWEDSRRPSWEVWNIVLGRLGFSEVQASDLTDKVVRKIPERLRTLQKIWRSDTWFVLSDHDGEHQWTRKGWSATLEFRPLENTWETLALLSKEKAKPRDAPAPHRAASPRDPREIRY